jgi:hypothetical protein
MEMERPVLAALTSWMGVGDARDLSAPRADRITRSVSSSSFSSTMYVAALGDPVQVDGATAGRSSRCAGHGGVTISGGAANATKLPLMRVTSRSRPCRAAAAVPLPVNRRILGACRGANSAASRGRSRIDRMESDHPTWAPRVVANRKAPIRQRRSRRASRGEPGSWRCRSHRGLPGGAGLPATPRGSVEGAPRTTRLR